MRLDAINRKKGKQSIIEKISADYNEQHKRSHYPQQESYESFTDEVPF